MYRSDNLVWLDSHRNHQRGGFGNYPEMLANNKSVWTGQEVELNHIFQGQHHYLIKYHYASDDRHERRVMRNIAKGDKGTIISCYPAMGLCPQCFGFGLCGMTCQRECGLQYHYQPIKLTGHDGPTFVDPYRLAWRLGGREALAVPMGMPVTEHSDVELERAEIPMLRLVKMVSDLSADPGAIDAAIYNREGTSMEEMVEAYREQMPGMQLADDSR